MTLKSLVAGAGLLALMAMPASADEITSFVKGGYAIGGTDPVAYFTDGKPVQGLDDFTAEYDGVTWKFASAAHRDAFKADPARYAPQYGGFCAFGASQGFKVPIIPEAWSIVDGKLYLNNNPNVQRRFEEETAEIIHNADLNWQIIKNTPPAALKEPIIR